MAETLPNGEGDDLQIPDDPAGYERLYTELTQPGDDSNEPVEE